MFFFFFKQKTEYGVSAFLVGPGIGKRDNLHPPPPRAHGGGRGRNYINLEFRRVLRFTIDFDTKTMHLAPPPRAHGGGKEYFYFGFWAVPKFTNRFRNQTDASCTPPPRPRGGGRNCFIHPPDPLTHPPLCYPRRTLPLQNNN